MAASDFSYIGWQGSNIIVVPMCVCLFCDAQLCYPTWWRELPDEDAWEVEIRCPECEDTSYGIYSHEEVVLFDEALNFGTDSVISDLNQLTRMNMEEYASLFRVALQDDHILPEDF